MVFTNKITTEFAGRRRFLFSLLIGSMTMLLGRAIDLQVLDRQFLQDKGKNQYISSIPVSAYRGKILDRNGELLAISTPIQSVWVNPRVFEATLDQRQRLRRLLGLSGRAFTQRVRRDGGRSFVYLRRRLKPSVANQIKAMDLPGVFFEKEYKRYYPAGEVSAHLVGFTDIDDSGQEGVELAYQERLVGLPGRRLVVRDGKRDIIEDIESIRAPEPGGDVHLTIDQRLQYLAYRELKAAYIKHHARAATLVMLDVDTGHVLAMANQPSFNPNSRKNLKGDRFRNRAVTDVFEPGSTIKPFAVACALDQGAYSPDSVIDTSPGTLRVGRNTVRDFRNYGALDIAHILQKSSNVGVSKIALSLSPDSLWECYNQLGFGHLVGVGFPGEAGGRLLEYQNWHRFEQATLSFGYGLSGSALQLARAYTSLANDGVVNTIKLVKNDRVDDSHSVMSAETAANVRAMLEKVVSPEGTANQASVVGYRIAGKTGTVKKASVGGYSDNRYLSVFAGMAPASNPKFVMVVVIDEPSAGDYYGGLVAAPVFSKVMTGTLRLLGIPPDQDHPSSLVQVRQVDSI